MSRSKSSHVRPVPVSSATRIIFIITPSSSAVSYRDSTALIVFIERNTCLTCVLTCVENILATTSTLSTSVKFWTDKHITFDESRRVCISRTNTTTMSTTIGATATTSRTILVRYMSEYVRYVHVHTMFGNGYL